MNSRADKTGVSWPSVRFRRIAEPVVWVVLACGVVASAISAKERGTVPSMVSVESTMQPQHKAIVTPVVLATRDDAPAVTMNLETDPVVPVTEIRWFDGRPMRPAKTVWMTVTAYSPDEASCGEFADGQTATLHSVSTNAMQLVAADPKVLPYGSTISIPGYAKEDIVPVLDCGGAIKGQRLDVLYPTHSRARKWGVQRLPVTIWEYADGKPATNPRKVR